MIEEYWWISWANVQYKEGYLGQMCNTKRDILGKCAIQRGIYGANVQLYTWQPLITQERRRRKVSGNL
jgi:hypothetical protein